MTPEIVPSLLSPHQGSEAFRRFQELFSRIHPSSIKLSTEMTNLPDGTALERSTLVANSALERAMVRKECCPGSEDRYSGGWYGCSGNETDLPLSEKEAHGLYHRLHKDVEIFLRRELSLLHTDELSALLKQTDWEITPHHRKVVCLHRKLVGHTVSATRHVDGARDSYDFGLEACSHVDPCEAGVKVWLARNGFSTFCYLKDEQAMGALTAICDTLGLEKFHLEEAALPKRELCK